LTLYGRSLPYLGESEPALSQLLLEIGGESTWRTEWIIENLQAALDMWNARSCGDRALITQSRKLQGRFDWGVIVNINGGLKAVGYACSYSSSLWAL
jgi:hypothetical protein